MLTTLSVLIALVVTSLLVTTSTNRTRCHQRKRKAARRVLAKIQSLPGWPQRLAYLRKIDPFTFEELLLDAFERRGYRIYRNRRYTGDDGIDGAVRRQGQVYLIQAKRYRGYIDRQHVMDFCQLLEQRRCHGFFCHTGRTGAAVRRLAERHPRMAILSAQRLLDLLSPVGSVDASEERNQIAKVKTIPDPRKSRSVTRTPIGPFGMSADKHRPSTS